jgi:hypothetical protein
MIDGSPKSTAPDGLTGISPRSVHELPPLEDVAFAEMENGGSTNPVVSLYPTTTFWPVESTPSDPPNWKMCVPSPSAVSPVGEFTRWFFGVLSFTTTTLGAGPLRLTLS